MARRVAVFRPAGAGALALLLLFGLTAAALAKAPVPPKRKTSAPASVSARGAPTLKVATPAPASAPAPVTAPAPAAPAKAPAGPPAVLSADTLTHEEGLGVFTATGRVELSHQGRTIYADTISYNQNTKIAVASGNVRMFETSGDVVAAEYAELTDDMADLFAERVRVLLSTGGRLVGNEAERTGGRTMRISRGVYSPCDLCRDDPNRAPLWQVQAVKIVRDEEEKEIRYKDATMEVAGIPVFYTPYLSHPDPTVERRSGMLAPIYGNNSTFGTFLQNRYYMDIAPEEDATFGLTAFSAENPLLEAEWRRRFERGDLVVSGSVTHSPYTEREDDGTLSSTTQPRGTLFADGRFDINQNWRWGGNFAYASDFSFLRQYYYEPTRNFLTSHGYVEGFHDRNYTGLHTYRFQSTLSNRTVRQPLVFPMLEYQALGAPAATLGGRWSFDAGVRGINRDGGADSTRLTLEPGWERQFVSESGVTAKVAVGARTDLYNFRDYTPSYAPTSGAQDGSEARLLPWGQLRVAYPLVSSGEVVDQVLEPLAVYNASPGVSSELAYPNEDSFDSEFSQATLFERNRFFGTDRQEGGQRVAAGLRYGVYAADGVGAEAMFGQSYRLSGAATFPYGSGLEDRASDYVGRVDLRPASWLDLGYRFRLDHDDLTKRGQNIGASFGTSVLNVSTSYDFLDSTADPYATQRSLQEYVTFSASSQVSRYWSAGISHAQAINPQPGPRSSALRFAYQDECLIFELLAKRDYTEVAGVENGTSALFRVVFLGLGEFTAPVMSGANTRNKAAN